TFDLVVREAVGITLAPGWNMISVPGQPLNTDPQSLISQVSGIVPPLYRWEAGTFSYQQVEELKLGESYWVLTTNESETVLEIPYQSVDSYVQSLPAGWNMIGSLSQTADFSQATDTPDDSIFPQSLFSWDAAGSSYQLSTQIEPGQGYWVLTLVDCQLTVQAGTTTTAAPMVAQTPELIFPLMIRGNNFRQQLHLGLDTSSNQGFDSFDQLMPPISPSTTGNRVQLVRAGYGLTQDVQPLQEGGSWTLEWSLQQSAQLQLDLSQLPKSHQLIISQAEETSVLQTGEAIEIAMGQGQLQLVLQPRVSRPEATRLLQNYPNPFNPETWIPFELKQTAEVELSIYDLRGQLVRQIDLGHKEAGHYLEPSTAIYWDGKTELGETIASGTYFYRLQAGSYNQIRKMIILK
ncbi:MAG: FlgD immunoglobulin-like domain containing protein, partial [Candidatus Poribacteria bacterium]|nr:FlgD immunoglobulin-like domain containing protein [Candidatus Poribacteria bacterium]